MSDKYFENWIPFHANDLAMSDTSVWKRKKREKNNAPTVPKDLAAEWAEKLKKSGFVDLEKQIFKDYTIEKQKFNVHSAFKLQPSYVEMMSKLFLVEHKLSKRNLLILQLHLDGFSQRKLLVQVNELYPPITQQSVAKAIKKMRKKAREL